jgi:hypothetical protein
MIWSLEIGMHVDGIIDEYNTLPEYRRMVTNETLNPIAGVPHLRANSLYYIINGHCNLLVLYLVK